MCQLPCEARLEWKNSNDTSLKARAGGVEANATTNAINATEMRSLFDLMDALLFVTPLQEVEQATCHPTMRSGRASPRELAVTLNSLQGAERRQREATTRCASPLDSSSAASATICARMSAAGRCCVRPPDAWPA